MSQQALDESLEFHFVLVGGDVPSLRLYFAAELCSWDLGQEMNLHSFDFKLWINSVTIDMGTDNIRVFLGDFLWVTSYVYLPLQFASNIWDFGMILVGNRSRNLWPTVLGSVMENSSQRDGGKGSSNSCPLCPHPLVIDSINCNSLLQLILQLSLTVAKH